MLHRVGEHPGELRLVLGGRKEGCRNKDIAARDCSRFVHSLARIVGNYSESERMPSVRHRGGESLPEGIDVLLHHRAFHGRGPGSDIRSQLTAECEFFSRLS
jgi:hypothetical protein